MPISKSFFKVKFKSCIIFSKLKVAPVVFVVPALELLKQTKKEFEKYLRLDGEPVKVGIAGDGICDLNMEGINVVTYQTVLGAYDKKYSESQSKVVDVAPSDGIRKSTAQIEEEYEKALKDLSIAKRSANKQLSGLENEIKGYLIPLKIIYNKQSKENKNITNSIFNKNIISWVFYSTIRADKLRTLLILKKNFKYLHIRLRIKLFFILLVLIILPKIILINLPKMKNFFN